jgi:Ca2+-binding RTX toxin-like protein
MATRSCVPAGLEGLEPRRLMAAAVNDGVLYVDGTGLSDSILIRQEPGTEKVPVFSVEIGPNDGSDRPTFLYQFPVSDVRSMVVRAGPGNDLVDLAIATYAVPALAGIKPVGVPTRVDGGFNDDEIYGGTARDTVSGGFGKDRIFGGDGNDFLDGGWGDDLLRGGNGDDFVYGGYGNDNVGGDEGNDRLFGGSGNDFLGSLGFGPRISEPGDDLLVGGPGEDRLVGGEGKDRILGGTGRDHFSRADDESEMLDRTPDEPIDIAMPV